MDARVHAERTDGDRVNGEKGLTRTMSKNLPLTKILLSLAAISVAAVATVGGTFANFTATPTTISSNAFASGSLTMTRSGTGAIFSSAAMKIGDTATGQVTITNTGTLAGTYTLTGSLSGGSSAALASQLHLTLYKDVDNTGTVVYDGSLGSFSASLGTFAASTGAHTFYFHVSLPSTGTDAGDNLLQGLSADESFTWSAVQA
jgi:spore coat-associated protein N